jgi:dolichol-phosphate mannosyltransferase
MKQILVGLPVINELSNLKILIPQLLEYLGDRGSIICIDDNSTDGTKEWFDDLMKKCSNIYYIRNSKKVGLGNAYRQAMHFAIHNNFEWFQQMDSDFSHRVSDLNKFDEVSNSADVIIGSRYVRGGKIENWPFKRRFLSLGGSLYARIILGCPVNDLTGGFNRTRISVLKYINLASVQSNGYSFQIELKYKAFKKGFRLKEVPITFTDRVDGSTKMNNKIVLEAIWKVWDLRFKN